MELMSIGKFAKKVGVNIATLRRMEVTGEFKPYHVSKGGTRYYSTEQLAYFGYEQNMSPKLTIGYCRVSTSSQKNDLEKQIENVKSYMIARGYQFDIITDIGSGINYNKAGLKRLLELINEKSIDKIVILYKDRLVRFGYELIENMCNLNNIEIEIIDNTNITKEQELSDDLIQMITIFANRLYGTRSKKTQKLIDEVKLNDSSQKD